MGNGKLLRRGKEGNEENPRKSKRQRKARDLYNATRSEYEPDTGAQTKDDVDKWLDELVPDAEFNLSSYAECFLSENLIRRYLHEYNVDLHKSAAPEIKKWLNNEKTHKAAANISFDIRKDKTGLAYLGMDLLALSAEGGKSNCTIFSDMLY